MFTEIDESWLSFAHPGLIPNGTRSISGTIEFRASYDKQGNQFLILDDKVIDGIEILSGSFHIRIEERSDKSGSRLPALYVQGIEAVAGRHFNQADGSACLCSPFDEDDFLKPDLEFRLFLEQLVIPFLYGQIYYSSAGHWPWPEYAHGVTGILEAYSKICDPRRAQECLERLVHDRNWPRIQSAIRQKPYVKGHIHCFCNSMRQIRRCHPTALKGLLSLQRDLSILGIPIP